LADQPLSIIHPSTSEEKAKACRRLLKNTPKPLTDVRGSVSAFVKRARYRAATARERYAQAFFSSLLE
jgi:hypothetical protein